MGKHAFLVLAHKDDYTFHTLLRLIDDSENDIFIHMDRKNHNYNFKSTEKLIKCSKVYHITPRVRVTWGAYSSIKAELNLLRTATETGKYDYYHLLSGEDLPIKSQKYIHDFFSRHKGKEFVQFQNRNFGYEERVKYFHLFQQKIGRGQGHLLISRINYYMLKLQKKVNVSRNQDIAFQKGANWFSITDSFARYVVKQMRWIKRTFRFTLCADEIFLQTILHNSEYKEKLFCRYYNDSTTANMRLIDWKRGGTVYVL